MVLNKKEVKGIAAEHFFSSTLMMVVFSLVKKKIMTALMQENCLKVKWEHRSLVDHGQNSKELSKKQQKKLSLQQNGLKIELKASWKVKKTKSI